jgi:putative phage-type endonuclease
MALSESALERRKNHVGASEVAAVMGLSPWKTAHDLWLEKTDKLEEKPLENESMGIGSMVEDGLLDWSAAEIGKKILKNQFRVHDGGIISATHDALVVGEPVGVEAKTAGIMNPMQARDEWGEEGTDEIPDYYILQTQTQCLVSGLEVVHVPALIGGRGRKMYRVERSDKICAAILERVTLFWMENVQKDIPPEGVPSLNIIRMRKREPGKVISLPAPLVVAWKELETKRKEVEKAEDEAKAAVLMAMQDAELGESDAGTVKVAKVKIQRLDTKALKAEQPEIAEKYTKESESVRMTWSKAKLLKA